MRTNPRTATRRQPRAPSDPLPRQETRPAGDLPSRRETRAVGDLPSRQETRLAGDLPSRRETRAVGDPLPRLVTRPLLVRFVSTLGAAASFYLMLSTVPEYARAVGASAGTAGLATTALTLSSVAAYLVAPRLIARYGYRPVLAAGLAALGVPALLLAAPAGIGASVAVIMAVCAVRGLGFAVACVAGYALTVSLIPPERRGEGLGLVGVVSGVPSVTCLPLGVWLAAHVGYRPVFVAGGVTALAGLASVPWLPGSGRAAGPSTGILAALRAPALNRPALTFSAVTMAVGVVVTFLPLAVAGTATDVAALALLVQPATAIGGRWLAGRYGDRRGPAVLLAPGVLLAAAGMLMLSLTAVPAAVIAGAAVFGAGFGVVQNASLTLMYDRVPESGYSAVSALWNLAYDGGMGLGAAAFSVIVVHTGYPAAFALTAAVLPAALAAAGRRQGLPVAAPEPRATSRSA
jgi:predicted MFS family arabinose efflux permease